MIYTLANLSTTASEIISTLSQSPNIWLFRGEMGAGKTTLVKEICQQLGVKGHVQSPTFSLVNEYSTEAGETIYHFDLYRLKNAQEAYAIGIEEYLASGNRCIIEWPEQAEALWDMPHVTVRIRTSAEETRELSISDE